MSATVLVVGGTGALGAPTAARLRDDGYRVRLLVRDPERSPRRSDDAEYVTGDLENPDTLRSALSGCQAVHVSVRGGPTAEQFDRIEHHATARLAQLAAQAGANRLTYVSHSLAAPDAPAADLRAKFHAEEAIAASGVPYTIFRPTYFMDTLPRHLRGRRALVLGRQPHALHMVAAADFARLVSRCLAVPDAAGKRLDVHGPEAITIPDALRTYCHQLAPGTRVVAMPLWSMTLADRTILRRQLRGTLGLMRALQQQGERGDPRQTTQLLGPVGTTLTEWLQTQAPV
jgi:uncharacterized protein YbjT (DUF2867 family)